MSYWTQTKEDRLSTMRALLMPNPHAAPDQTLFTPMPSGSISTPGKESQTPPTPIARKRLEQYLLSVMTLGFLGLCLLIAATASTVIGRSTARLDPWSGAATLQLSKHSHISMD